VISRASIFECVAVMDILSDEKIISKEEFIEFTEKAEELSKILYAMIKNLS
jgi:four helix bundle protein